MNWPAGAPALLIDTVSMRGVLGSALVADRARWVLAVVATATAGSTAAMVGLYSGDPDTGARLLTIAVPAGATFTWSPGPPGIPAESGLWVSVAGAAVDLSVTTGVLT